MTNRLDKLERAAACSRGPRDPHDRRGVLLELSPLRARRRFDQLHRHRGQLESANFSQRSARRTSNNSTDLLQALLTSLQAERGEL